MNLNVVLICSSLTVTDTEYVHVCSVATSVHFSGTCLSSLFVCFYADFSLLPMDVEEDVFYVLEIVLPMV